MNKIINLAKLLGFFVLLLLYSCSSEVEVDNSSCSKVSQEPLKINVLDSSDTRSIISGTSLPDDCVFKIYVYTYEGDLMGENRRNPQLFSSPDGVPVHYKDGICTVREDIFLPTDKHVLVEAIFENGDAKSLAKGFNISIDKQEDFLYGKQEGNVVDPMKPVANIYFNHEMSRVTLNIRKSEDNKKVYDIPTLTVKNIIGEVNYSHPALYLVDKTESSVLTDLVVETNNSKLASSSDVVTADFLLFPKIHENIAIEIGNGAESTSFKLTTGIFDPGSGGHYTFNVTLNGENSSIVEKEHEFVDLGLPSGIKWATHNLDISLPNKETASPEDWGGYYGWADPTGRQISEEEDDYPNSAPPSSICGTDYDIAHVQWGKNWRLPTDKEQQELFEKCKWKQETINGKKCYRVTGPNGNSLIFPRANMVGSHNGISLWNTETGYYMSGECFKSSDEQYHVYILSFGEDTSIAFDRWAAHRSWHLSVRPVTQ